jgi:hypothetical protein
MGQLLLNYLIPVGIVIIGILSGVLPSPSVPALWAIGLVCALLAVWFLVHAYGLGRTAFFAAVALGFSFCTEYVLVNPLGILTHYSQPQLAGAAMLALLQDFVMVAASYILAAALFSSGGILTRAVASGAILLLATLVSGPFASTLGYYTYNEPFLAWGQSIGLEGVPPVPWAEPIGNPIIPMLTTIAFEGIVAPRRERRFSPKWAALFFSSQTLPAWAWTAQMGLWGHFALSTLLLAAIVALTIRAELALDRNAKRPSISEVSVTDKSPEFTHRRT